MNTGRPKKPIESKIIEGTFRKDRANNGRLQFTRLSEVPEPEGWLSKIAKTYWKYICETLIQESILTNADLGIVRQLSQAYEESQLAYEALGLEGYTHKHKTGYSSKNPWYDIKEKADKKIRELSNILGFSPSAREKLTAQGMKEVENKLTGIMKEMQAYKENKIK